MFLDFASGANTFRGMGAILLFVFATPTQVDTIESCMDIRAYTS